jgi:hypothetical protein
MIPEPAPTLKRVDLLLRRSQRLGLLTASIMTTLPVLEWWGHGLTRTFGLYTALAVFVWGLQVRQAFALRQFQSRLPNEEL